MRFTQTIWFSTSKYDEMQKMMDEFSEQQAEPSPGFLGLKILKDRDHENMYLVVAEFDSYEQAMENSALPETDAFAKRMAALADGPPAFGNFDVVHEETP
jgi:heme-degrading monooxygenase HmoA